MSIRKGRAEKAHAEVVNLEVEIRDLKKAGKWYEAGLLEKAQAHAFRRLKSALAAEDVAEKQMQKREREKRGS